MTAIFEPPGHVTPLADHALVLQHTNTVLKPGFRPQTLAAQVNGLVLQVQRGRQSGRPVAEPDSGFFTQVYLGGSEPFIELEQLSSTWSPAEPAACTIILSVEPAQTPAAW